MIRPELDADIVEIRRRAGLTEDRWNGVPMWEVEHHTTGAARPFVTDGPLDVMLREIEKILTSQTEGLVQLVVKPYVDQRK